MRLNTFENLYADQLHDLYSAENQLIEALPKMAEAATTPELQQAFTQHLEETRQHAEILQGLLSAIGEGASGEKCKGMEGLLKEGKEVLEKRGDPAVKDAALIAAAQRVEHYEIAGYGTARTFALQLGYNDAVNRLQDILNQESDTDELLTKIATGEGGSEVAVNQEAASHESQSSNGSRSSSASRSSNDSKSDNDSKSSNASKQSKDSKSSNVAQVSDALQRAPKSDRAVEAGRSAQTDNASQTKRAQQPRKSAQSDRSEQPDASSQKSSKS